MTDRGDFTVPDREFWEDAWGHFDPDDTGARQEVLLGAGMFEPVLGPLLPEDSSLTALEIGCYPGANLTWLSRRFGYEVSGFDFVEQVRTLRPLLEREGAVVGSLEQGDFFTVEPRPEFDVVTSFGFVEHFADFDGVIARQVAWAKPGGLVVVLIPRFRRAQWLLHRTLDRANLSIHNVKAMDPKAMRRALEAAGADIVHLELFGTCHFFYGPDERRSRATTFVTKAVSRATRLVDDAVARRRPAGYANSLFSPYLLAVARRR